MLLSFALSVFFEEEKKKSGRANSTQLDPDLPPEYQDAWDDTHVRLPCSPRNTYRRRSNKDKDLSRFERHTAKRYIDTEWVFVFVSARWYLIQTALAEGIASSTDLHEAILSYHPKVASSWDFSGMHNFFNTIITKDESALFFSSLLPRIIHLAFQLPHLCTRPILLLVRINAAFGLCCETSNLILPVLGARTGPNRVTVANADRVAVGQRVPVHLPSPGPARRYFVRPQCFFIIALA